MRGTKTVKTKFSRRTFLGQMGVALGVMNLAGRSTGAVSADKRPNIILMMADDMGWGDVGFNGGKIIQTPYLDEMAAAALKFTRFYSGAPVCSPTRGSCLTGRHPFRYGIYSANQGHMKPEELTLPELLKKFGYATGHFGKWHLGTMAPDYSGKAGREPEKHYSTPGMNGFDEWFSTEFAVATWDPYDPNHSHLSSKTRWNTRALYWHNGVNVTGGLEGDDSRIVMDKAIPFIENAVDRKKPFFTVIWFHAPHAPVVGGPEFLKLYGAYEEEPRHYYACITALDRQVGRLRKALRDSRVAGNTMIFFCSDNGPEGDEQGGRNAGSAGPFRGRKRSLFEGGIRVPSLLEWPDRIKPGSVTDYPAVTSDYLPTILEVLGIEMPDARPIDGISLMPVIDEDRKQRPAPIAFETLGGFGLKSSRSSPKTALIDNRFKLLTDFDPGGKGDMLFDLVEDPGETHNLIGEHLLLIEKMKTTLKVWRESCQRSDGGGDYRP